MVLLGVLENLMLENTAKLKPQQIKVNSASYELETYMQRDLQQLIANGAHLIQCKICQTNESFK